MMWRLLSCRRRPPSRCTDDRHPGPCDCGDLRRPNWSLMRQLARLYLQVSSSSSCSLLLPPSLSSSFFLCFFAFLRRVRPEAPIRSVGGYREGIKWHPAGLPGLPVSRVSLCTELPARRVPSPGFIPSVFLTLKGHILS